MGFARLQRAGADPDVAFRAQPGDDARKDQTSRFAVATPRAIVAAAEFDEEEARDGHCWMQDVIWIADLSARAFGAVFDVVHSI
jgi:hypothetical protein